MIAYTHQLTDMPDYVTYITALLFLLVLIALAGLWLTPGGTHELDLYDEDEENI